LSVLRAEVLLVVCAADDQWADWVTADLDVD
jgi:hypothetical protein